MSNKRDEERSWRSDEEYRVGDDPELKKFLDFWTRELDGLLHSVTIAHARLIKPAEFRAVEGEFRLN